MKLQLPLLLACLSLAYVSSAQFDEPILLHLSSDFTQTAKLKAADLNNDGVAELILPHADFIYSYDPVANGAFAEWAWTPDVISEDAALCFAIETADMDGNGYQDVYVAPGSEILLLLNQGDGTFNPVNIPLPVNATMARHHGTGDLDGDGDLDITIGINDFVGWVENIDGWTSYEVHTIDQGIPALRGSFCVDFDGDGDLEVLTIPGGIGVVMRVYDNDGEGWISENINNTNGGTYCYDIDDVDGDGDLDLGFGSNLLTYFIDLGTGEIQTVPVEGGLPEGGQFWNLDDDSALEWIYVDWSGGAITVIDFDTSGQVAGTAELDIEIPLAHDFQIVDGNGDSYPDLFYCFFGDPSDKLGVCPGNGQLVTNVQEIAAPGFTAWYASGNLNLSDMSGTPESIMITDLTGKIIFTEAVYQTPGAQFTRTIDLPTGIYIVTLTWEHSSESRKFLAR